MRWANWMCVTQWNSVTPLDMVRNMIALAKVPQASIPSPKSLCYHITKLLKLLKRYCALNIRCFSNMHFDIVGFWHTQHLNPFVWPATHSEYQSIPTIRQSLPCIQATLRDDSLMCVVYYLYIYMLLKFKASNFKGLQMICVFCSHP